MKKCILLVSATLQVTGLFCQSAAAGRLKISIENVKCITKCWDGVVEFDGHGNEISVTYAYRIYNPSNPNAARKSADGTVIYGSNVNGMTKAGTQTPDLGGITDGDVVNIFKPIMDEHVNADDYIIIAPTVWEWDGPEKNTMSSFNTQLEDDLFWITHQPFPFTNTAVSYTDPFGDRVVNASKYPAYDGNTSRYQDIFKNYLCPTMREGNRPVGISSGTYNNQCKVLYLPNLVVLDTRTLYAQYINNKNANSAGTSHAEKEAKGIFINGLTVTFRENNYNFPDSHGIYTVSLKIEFIPDLSVVTSNTTAAAPAINNTGIGISKSLPVKNTSIVNGAPSAQSYTMNNEMMYGQWKGTLSSNDGSKPGPFAFKINNGAFWLQDNTGASVASGGFKIENNNFTSTYSYPNGNSYTIISTGYNAATGELSGTWWGNGAIAAKKGNWKAVRVTN